MDMDRRQIAEVIIAKLEKNKGELASQFSNRLNPIRCFFIDDLLPAELVEAVYSRFPSPGDMVLKKSLREYKYIAAQMNNYDLLLEEVIYAFQDARVIEMISEICGIDDLVSDENLYAGGISLMAPGNFLNPHLDNSHDKDRKQFRVLNLLFYVSPDWKLENGGNLELWQHGLSKPQMVIESRFNRLAVMETHEKSWHSVSPVLGEQNRCCVSNYYFSDKPVGKTSAYHVTSFRGRPGQFWRDQLLQFDNFIRWSIKKLTGEMLFKNPHVYKK